MARLRFVLLSLALLPNFYYWKAVKVPLQFILPLDMATLLVLGNGVGLVLLMRSLAGGAFRYRQSTIDHIGSRRIREQAHSVSRLFLARECPGARRGNPGTNIGQLHQRPPGYVPKRYEACCL